ncbi:hypothetical protein C1M53_16315 [Mesorhizobium sp. Pch-S]|nr:hypothetical protein C1M53_16315 [Mesorhizobium sp. Pch-S]
MTRLLGGEMDAILTPEQAAASGCDFADRGQTNDDDRGWHPAGCWRRPQFGYCRRGIGKQHQECVEAGARLVTQEGGGDVAFHNDGDLQIDPQIAGPRPQSSANHPAADFSWNVAANADLASQSQDTGRFRLFGFVAELQHQAASAGSDAVLRIDGHALNTVATATQAREDLFNHGNRLGCVAHDASSPVLAKRPC